MYHVLCIISLVSITHNVIQLMYYYNVIVPVYITTSIMMYECE